MAHLAPRLLLFCLVHGSVFGQHFLRLEDVVAGGDGSGNAPTANTGIDIQTGQFVSSYFDGRTFDTNGVSPTPVPGSPFIDSVFFLSGGTPICPGGVCIGLYRQPITQSGVTAAMNDAHGIGSGWNYILKNRVGGISEPGIRVGGADFFTTSIGLHASMGITLNLDELRRAHGNAAVGCFSTFWGMDDCASGQVEMMAILSNDGGVLDPRSATFTAGQGDFLTLEIPPAARYLTLAAGSSGADACDHGTFARPIITPLPCPEPSEPWMWSIWPTRVAPGGDFVSIAGEAFSPEYSFRVGGIDLLNQVHVGDTRRLGTTPQLAPGVYDVELHWFGFVGARLANAVEVVPPPVLTSVTPSVVLMDRSTPVTIRGTNLRSDMTIVVRDNFDDGVELPIENQSLISDGVVTGSLPRLPPGLAPGEKSLLVLDQDRRREDWGVVTYVSSGIERVEPATVSTDGGTEVTFFGLNLGAAAAFRLGGQPLTNVVVLDAQRVRGTSPALPQGSHPAELVNAGGGVIHTLAGAVTAVPPAPLAIASISPNRVYSLGGAVVTIRTTAAHRGATPRVDGITLVNAAVVDAVTLRGEVPPLAVGFHDVDLVDANDVVVVAAPNGLEAVSDAGIAITGVNPTVVSTLGGTEVTFTGTGFYEGFVPRVGGMPLDGVTFEGTTRLRGTTRPLDPGPQGAALHHSDFALARWAGTLTAVAPAVPADMYIGQVRPGRIAAGASTVRFAGTSFPADIVPRIGGVPLVGFRAVSSCRYEGMAPVLPPGLYVADLFRPGFGIVAELKELVEVAAPGVAPKPSHIVSARVLADGSTKLYVFGHDFTSQTIIIVGGRPLLDPVFVSDELIVGNAPPLAPGEALGVRTVAASDSRGTGVLENGVRYREPETPGDPTFIRGDSNQSGRIDLSDAVFILGFLFLGSPASIACLDAADPDANGKIELTDAVYLLQFLFLGGREPGAPFPDCGRPSAAGLGCGSAGACGGGGGGIAASVVTLCTNVKTLVETPENPLDPIVVEIAPEGLEIVIRDPPGGIDLAPGDVIVGPTPLESDAVHNGVAYMLKLEEAVAGSCLAAGDGGGAGLVQDKVFRIRPARFDEVITDGVVRVDQEDFSGAKVSYSRFAGHLACDIVNAGAGGAASEAEQGQGGACISDCVAIKVNQPVPLYDYVSDDGESYLHLGFSRCEVDYQAGTTMDVDFNLRKLKKFRVFSGARLDSTVEFSVNARAHGSYKREESVKKETKHELIVLSVGGLIVVILVVVEAELFVGVDLEAEINMDFTAGATGRFKAGLGIERVNGVVTNISDLELPTLEPLPGTPSFHLDGSASVRGYVRPQGSIFGGLYIAALTGKIRLSPELHARVAVEGSTSPPCFEYGLFAGGKLEVHPEIQFFGTDVWDPPPFSIAREFKLLGDEIGCKLPPVVVLNRRDEVQGNRLLIHLDATGSKDPDGGPVNFRWDFDSDGICDRNTGSEPRTTYVYDPSVSSICRTFDCSHVITLRVTDDEQTYSEKSTGFRTTGSAAGQLRLTNVLAP
jgi:hypothetical protein